MEKGGGRCGKGKRAFYWFNAHIRIFCILETFLLWHMYMIECRATARIQHALKLFKFLHHAKSCLNAATLPYAFLSLSTPIYHLRFSIVEDDKRRICNPILGRFMSGMMCVYGFEYISQRIHLGVVWSPGKHGGEICFRSWRMERLLAFLLGV